MMRIGLMYAYTDAPWGGINTFFRTFANRLQQERNVISDGPVHKADIILSSGHFYAPGKLLKTRHVSNLSNARPLWHPLGRIGSKGTKTKLVWRVDGLRAVYAEGAGSYSDSLLEANLPYGSATIFQSRFSRECFIRAAYNYPKPEKTIHNGASAADFYPNSLRKSSSVKIILMSNSWSTNERKGFDLLVEFSRLPGVEVRHIGRWPENLNPENVILLGPRRQPEVAELLRDGDYFVFPSQFDACSNVVVEALASGLPVIYHNSGGTPELCQEGRFGIPLPDNWSGSSQVVLESLIERGEDMKRDLRDNNNIFSFENCYQSYLIFFEALLADRLER